MITIRPYKPSDEKAWLASRVLSLLNSAYFDDVAQAKPVYENPVIDLVAEEDHKLVGLIEVECETNPATVCSDRPGLGGMIWNIAVHPDYQRRGVANKLLNEAKRRAAERGIVRFEAYTRDDPGVLDWYKTNGFQLLMSYLHVYLDYDEAREVLHSTIPGLKPVKVFAHYSKDDREAVRRKFQRVYDCNLFELRF